MEREWAGWTLDLLNTSVLQDLVSILDSTQMQLCGVGDETFGDEGGTWIGKLGQYVSGSSVQHLSRLCIPMGQAPSNPFEKLH